MSGNGQYDGLAIPIAPPIDVCGIALGQAIDQC